MPVTGDLTLMVNLQRLWDIIRKEKENIERAEKSIEFWIQKVSDLKKRTADLSARLQAFKVVTKTNENLLNELDQKLKTFEERKGIIKNEKELNALNSQIEKIVADRDLLENQILSSFDEIQESENTVENLQAETSDAEVQTENDIKILREKIIEHNREIDIAAAEFNRSAESLSVSYKTRFIKLLNSKEGKSIIPIKDGICSLCNNKQPPSIAMDVLKGDSIPICVNCGRFLYITNS
jgi:predicted  nucleic acid-binding Zn-ribbon protein